ncbi:MAG: M23 family metallopeptidase [Bacteroidetes bacterium]|nr:M23 family metallopeptidase [Bacteroidota bacterium]
MSQFFKKIAVLIFSISIIGSSYSQTNFSKKYFRSPLDIPLRLTGNFGELRATHFHSGIDIKTQGVIGKKIYAVANGYVSRIKISPFGYGKALYISHENGTVSVYGHLNEFNIHIDKYVKDKQYLEQTFAIDIFPKKNEIPIQKGEVVALSGNSGSSAGPHLHFELRNKKTEHPINPLLFKFNIIDNIKPRIYKLYIYPLDEYSYVNKSNNKNTFQVIGNNGKYFLKQKNAIIAHNKIGFALKTNDFLNNSRNKCGIYSIELRVDSNLIFYNKFDEFSFSETKNIKSYTDYNENIRHKNRFHKCFVQANNSISIYKKVKDRGIVNFSDNNIHKVKFIVKDVYNNTSILNFDLKSSSQEKSIIDTSYRLCTQIMPYGKINFFANDDVKIFFPENSLYSTLFFQYSKSEPVKGSLTPVYHIHNCYTPIKEKYSLSIKIDSLSDSLINKTIIAYVDKKNKMYAIEKKWKHEQNFIEIKTNKLGNFTVAIDTIPPRIIPLNFTESTNLNTLKNIKFKITDNLSGINTYNGFIDENWVLFEYDAKNHLLTYVFDEKIGKKNIHSLILKVSDRVGNITTYSHSLNFVKKSIGQQNEM